MVKRIAIGIGIVIVIILAIIFKNFVSGILVGGVGAIVYFKYTKSTLNFKKKK